MTVSIILPSGPVASAVRSPPRAFCSIDLSLVSLKMLSSEFKLFKGDVTVTAETHFFWVVEKQVPCNTHPTRRSPCLVTGEKK